MVCKDIEEGNMAVKAMLSDGAYGVAGTTILVEEFMDGEELSVFVVTDGERAVPLVPAQDHKRLLDGDLGPNTGGMGAYAPVSIHTAVGGPLMPGIMDRIIDPVLAALDDAGHPFTGLLYAGLMLTRSGPRVVEFNCRFGDPETQAVLPILDASPSLFDLMRAVGYGEALPDKAVVTARAAAVTTVLAAQGYPESARSGDVIHLPPPAEDVLVFHAGTKRLEDGALATAGGRVLAVTAVADDVAAAARKSRAVAEQVSFSGNQFRGDIGWRALARGARAS
jgi:phosphoribosylamine--glycine ligase